jgi:predicted amidohydrolase
MPVKIAVVQFEIQQFVPEANLKKAECFIKEASAEAQIIVFPEDFVVGPLQGRKEFIDNEGRYVKHFQQLAATCKIDIVAGSIPEGYNGDLYNTTYYIDSAGTIRGSYRKVNLWLSERSYITPGKETCVFDTGYGRVGLIICWDLMFPEIFRTMLKQGVEIVICPSYWCLEDAGIGIKHDEQAEIKLVNALCVTRAFENEVVLVYANAAGTVGDGENKSILIGQSQITLPFKGAVRSLHHNQEAMFMQEVDTSILGDAEIAYQIKQDLKNVVLP